MKNEALFNEDHEATYCPEDDKIRLYVGRVPREEYLALKSEGWKSTPKQDCDFVAVWTVDREETALSYAGIILDEDQSPTDRAADRAERFSGYLDKRRAEAHGHADTYESGPQAHGYQNQRKAERAAARHDRFADRACDAWSKAEYWQSRTAGVISNALYKSTPGVRMGRIKKIEKQIRAYEKTRKENDGFRDIFAKIAENPDTEKANADALTVAGSIPYGGYKFQHPRNPERIETLWHLLDDESSDPVTAREAAEMYAARFPADRPEHRAHQHANLRLAYENQMLEAAGGRAGDVEMIPGGFVNGYQIQKVNKSRQSGRVVSVVVLAPSGVYFFKDGRQTRGDGNGKLSAASVRVERLAPDACRAPTAEELADFELLKAATKAAKPKIPTINPTAEEAERLQSRLNQDDSKRNYPKPGEVVEMTQEAFSYRARGSDWLGVKLYDLDGERFKVRTVWNLGADSVVILTDKPQKALPAFGEVAPLPEFPAAKLGDLARIMDGGGFVFSREDSQTVKEAKAAELIEETEGRHPYKWTEAGTKLCPEKKAEPAPEATTAAAVQQELF